MNLVVREAHCVVRAAIRLLAVIRYAHSQLCMDVCDVRLSLAPRPSTNDRFVADFVQGLMPEVGLVMEVGQNLRLHGVTRDLRFRPSQQLRRESTTAEHNPRQGGDGAYCNFICCIWTEHAMQTAKRCMSLVDLGARRSAQRLGVL
jgi:hypothetical protein